MRALVTLVLLLLVVGIHLVHVNADAIAEALFGSPPSFGRPAATAAPPASPAGAEAWSAPTAAAKAEAPASTAAPAVPLLGDEWTAATVDGLLAQHPELRLDAEETVRLKDIYVYCQNVRTAYEAGIAEVLSITPTRAKIRIPPYPEAGARLQQMWEDELTAELGEERSLEVEARLGETFDVAFKMFGAGAQHLEVDLVRAEQEGWAYRILAQLEFADVDSPELGLDESRLFSTTGTYVLKPETVATGEWRPLAKHFPRLPESGAEAPVESAPAAR